MELWELLLIGVGLSMDAFAVSICKGLTARQATLGRCLTAGAYFGGFQALMPLLGYLWAPAWRPLSSTWTTGLPLCCWG